MKRAIIILTIILSGHIASSQVELITMIVKSLNIGRGNQIKNDLLQGKPVTIQFAEVVERIKNRPRKQKRKNKRHGKKR